MRILYFVVQLFLGALFLTSSFAQVNYNYHPLSNSLIISLEGGGTYSFSDYEKSDVGLAFGGSLEYYLPTNSKNLFGLKLNGSFSQLSGNESNLGFNKLAPKFETNTMSAGLGLIYSYAYSQKFLPYISLSGNFLVFDYVSRNVQSSFLELSNDTQDNSLSIGAMGGIKYKINDITDFNFGVGYNYVLDDNIDAIKYGEYEDNYFSGVIGFSFRIWNQRDSDNDGINDDVDKCPYEEEDIDGFEDEDGCPDLDNDGDGIIDFKDGCQNIAEDIDGFQDEDGCPDPDNDGDGILDVDDSCPDIAEDFDGFEDEDGCPDADNDGDGILDNIDQCIDEAEVFNGFQDEDGCPDELPKPVYVEPTPKVVKKRPPKNNKTKTKVSNAPSSFLIHSETTFSSNSAQIKSSAYSELNRIVEELKKHPNTSWRIEGHTDTKDSRTEANRITKNQADAILSYFVSKGLSSSKFQALGFGDASPIASNSSVYGRMKNRRIIIRKID